jgi:hypothetical protein
MQTFTTRVLTNRGGIWAPNGASTDSSGNLYVATGNTDSTGQPDDGESVIKLSPSLARLDYFTAPEWSALNAADLDVGSIGPGLRDQPQPHVHECQSYRRDALRGAGLLWQRRGDWRGSLRRTSDCLRGLYE